MRDKENPYEVWQDTSPGFEWRVLKRYQFPKHERKNNYARWYCAVRSPMTYGSWEYGDTYISDIKNYSTSYTDHTYKH